MKKISILLPFLLLIITGYSQPLENGTHAMASVGINISMQPVASAGFAVNVGRLYAGIHGTLPVNFVDPVTSEARIGIVLGRELTAVPYAGLAYVGAGGEDYKAGMAKTIALAYGVILTAPTNWDKTTLTIGSHFYQAGKDVTVNVLVGIKMRLSKSYPCYSN